MGSFLKKLLPIALAVAAPFAAPAIGTAFGLSGALGAAAGGAALGGVGGLASGGGLKSALLGGATGGIGGYVGGGGLGSIGGGASNSFGSYDKLLSSGPLSAVKNAAIQAPSFGSSASSFLNNNSGNILSGLSSALKGSAGNILNAGEKYKTSKDIEEKLKQSQLLSQQALEPYTAAGREGIGNLSAGFDSSNLSSDPGYQFRLQEGNQALERSLAARGLTDSGQALKSAQEYGQGLASQTYNDAYDQFLRKNNALANYGQNATEALVRPYGTYETLGNIGASGTGYRSNLLTSTLSDLLRGNKKQIISRDEFGNPIYEE